MPLPQNVVGPLTSLVVSLINLQSPPSRDYPKRYYSTLFRELPARELYPDYYIFIKEPRSLNGIMDSMKKGIYSSPHAVAYDLFLIWSNARQYNQQGSQVYADADLLENHMRQLWNERSPPLPPFSNLLRPEQLNPPTAPRAPIPAPAPVATPAPPIKRIKLTSSYSAAPPPPPPLAHASTSGTPAPARASAHLRVAGPGPSTPAPSTPSNPPLTLKLALKPPAPPPSASADPSYPSASPMGTPAPAHVGGYDEMPKEKKRSRERETTPGGSEKPRTERKREKKAREKAEKKARERAEKEAAEAGSADVPQVPIIPGIPDVESGWMSDAGSNPREVYLDVIRKLREHTDAKGRPLATPLLTVPDPTSRPDYHQMVKDPIALDTIEYKVNNGLYPSAEAFDRDLYHLFTVAKLFIRRDSLGSIYSDLIVLQRLYYELTKRRSALEPAPSLGTGSLASVAVGPGNAAIKNEGGTNDVQTGLTSRVTLKDKIFLEGINFKGQVFRTGDWVHLLNPDNPKKPIIGQIFKVYKRPDSPQRCISVCWYYRPEETVHPASRQFYENEVFKTGNFGDHSIEDFVERCMVMSHSKYIRGRPKAPTWTPGMPIYVCEHRYKDDVKIFKKIKNWPLCLPEELRRHEYDFEPFPNDHVDQPLRVKSPFVRGVEGPGRLGEAVGGQEPEQTKYHFLPGGEPATPSAMKAAREQQRKQQAEEAAALAQRAQEAAAKAAATTPTLYGGAPPPSNIVTLGSPAVLAAQGIASPSPAPPISSAIPIVLRPDLAHSPSTSALEYQPQAPPKPAGPPPGATPAEIAVMTESFAELPGNLKSKFRSTPLGDLLWFTAPAASVPVVKKPNHSLEYLYWRAMQKKEARTRGGEVNGNGMGEVQMREVA